MPVIISHGSFLGPDDYELLKSTDQYVSITIESEMNTAQTNPTSVFFLDQSSLGIDSFYMISSDLLTQARIFIEYVRNYFYSRILANWEVPANSPMSAAQAFILATRNGGMALRRPDLGVIAPGAKADVLVWDTSNPAMLGWVDPIAAVLMHASPTDVQDVLVDGKFMKRDGKLLVPDLERAKAKFVESATHVQQATLKRPRLRPHEHDGDIHVSGAKVAYIPIVDVVRGEGDGYVLKK